MITGGAERQDRPVNIVSLLLNARLYDDVSINCIDNAAEAHLGPSNDLSERLAVLRRNNLEVWFTRVSRFPLVFPMALTASFYLAVLDLGTLFSTSLPTSRVVPVTGQRLTI